ncbi:MAG: cytochrome c oxidase assembly protein [Candidatus Dormibacteria bacterium]
MSFWEVWAQLHAYAFQPGAWLPILAAGFLYWRGRRVMLRQPQPGDPGIGGWRVFAFYMALFLILFVTQGPVAYLSYKLFWMEMVEHCTMQMLAPLLLLAGAPLLPWWRGLPLSWRRAIAPPALVLARLPQVRLTGRVLRKPAVGVAALAGTFWLWHVPFVLDVTLNNAFLHGLEFATLLLAGLVYWSQTLDSYPLKKQLSTWPTAGYLVAGTAVMWVVALSLGFSTQAYYSVYSQLSSRPGGISAVTDQQWGAGVAWVPAAIPAEIMLDITVVAWLREDERRSDAETERYRRARTAAVQEQSAPPDR